MAPVVRAKNFTKNADILGIFDLNFAFFSQILEKYYGILFIASLILLVWPILRRYSCFPPVHVSINLGVSVSVIPGIFFV